MAIELIGLHSIQFDSCDHIFFVLLFVSHEKRNEEKQRNVLVKAQYYFICIAKCIAVISKISSILFSSSDAIVVLSSKQQTNECFDQ